VDQQVVVGAPDVATLVLRGAIEQRRPHRLQDLGRDRVLLQELVAGREVVGASGNRSIARSTSASVVFARRSSRSPRRSRAAFEPCEMPAICTCLCRNQASQCFVLTLARGCVTARRPPPGLPVGAGSIGAHTATGASFWNGSGGLARHSETGLFPKAGPCIAH
jgi:hypothetical protein